MSDPRIKGNINPKNYIPENKNQVLNHDIHSKTKTKEDLKGLESNHKNFGKVPN